MRIGGNPTIYFSVQSARLTDAPTPANLNDLFHLVGDDILRVAGHELSALCRIGLLRNVHEGVNPKPRKGVARSVTHCSGLAVSEMPNRPIVCQKRRR